MIRETHFIYNEVHSNLLCFLYLVLWIPAYTGMTEIAGMIENFSHALHL